MVNSVFRIVGTEEDPFEVEGYGDKTIQAARNHAGKDNRGWQRQIAFVGFTTNSTDKANKRLKGRTLLPMKFRETKH